MIGIHAVLQWIRTAATTLWTNFKVEIQGPDVFNSEHPLKIMGGPRGGPSPVYLSLFHAGNPGLMTNAWITINGPCFTATPADPIPITIAGEGSYMLGIESDTNAPTVVVMTNEGPFFRLYSNTSSLQLEINKYGQLTFKGQVADFPANVVGYATLYLDTSGVKAKLMMRFPTGAAVQVAIEP